MTVAEAARRGKASEQSVSTWKRQFVEGGKTGLAESGRLKSNLRERALQDEIEELKAALGEAHVELRVWKRSAENRLGPTRGKSPECRMRSRPRIEMYGWAPLGALRDAPAHVDPG